MSSCSLGCSPSAHVFSDCDTFPTTTSRGVAAGRTRQVTGIDETCWRRPSVATATGSPCASGPGAGNIRRAKAFGWTYLGGLFAVRNTRRIGTGDYDRDRRQRNTSGAWLFTRGGGTRLSVRCSDELPVSGTRQLLVGTAIGRVLLQPLSHEQPELSGKPTVIGKHSDVRSPQ